MNYLKHYIKLIRNAENREVPNCYVEGHHVFPKSIFGDNKKIVKLTAREHYIAHALLEKIYVQRYGMKNAFTHKMIRAFFMMNNRESSNQQRYHNSRLYEFNKLKFIDSISGENSPMYGKKRIFTESHLANLKASRTHGIDNPLFGIPRSEEIKQKLRKPKHAGHGAAVSKSKTGVPLSDEHRRNLSESHKGQVSWNKGKTYSEESKLKMSISQKNKDNDVYRTDEYRKKQSEHSKKIWAERKAKQLEALSNVVE